MANHPKRYYGTNELHFINCSCYHRHPWLAAPKRRDLFLTVLEQVRQRYRFVVVGYVVMPDHIHLLISEPERGDPSRVTQAVKQAISRSRECGETWGTRYSDKSLSVLLHLGF